MYIYAKLSKYEFLGARFFGSGLGNILFPWARSVIAAKKYHFQCIHPTWMNLRIGSILRNENDLRFYSDLFINSSNNICGFKKHILLLLLKKIPEDKIKQHPICENLVVIYSGINEYFQPIINDHEYIKAQLVKMTSPKYLKGLSYDFSNSISLHIRLGDFKVGNQVTSIFWLLDVVNLIRKRTGKNLRVYIFSDGNDSELSPLLTLNNSQRLSFGSSIADLLALSKSTILIGSKGSTFSMWAAYLGRMPIIWPTGGLIHKLYQDNSFREIESDGFSFPEDFYLHMLHSLQIDL